MFPIPAAVCMGNIIIMEVNMKKWISYILLSALLITALPTFTARAAANCTGNLTANGNNIDVALSFPQASEENITSLHFRINVSIESGKMDAPLFQFADTVKSEVQDSKVINSSTDNSSYVIDIILSGKKDKIIFPQSGQAGIGIISLRPSSDAYKISVNFTGIKEGYTNPEAEYVTDNGQLLQTAAITNTETAIIDKNSTQQQPGNSYFPYIPGPAPSATATVTPDVTTSPTPSSTPEATASLPPATSTPSVTSTPEATKTPEATVTPSSSPDNTQSPLPQETPVSFDTQAKPSVSASLIKGSRNVNLKWNLVEGADGYIIYNYTKQPAKYKRLKTIANPAATSYKLKLNYASSYSLRVRAFQTADDGSRIFGKYSNIRKITTAPAKAKKLKARFSGNKAALSWKKVKNAAGYQIYASNKKGRGYSLIKTLKKGSVIKTTIKKGKKTSYFRIRAYVKNANGKRVYGNFCTAVKAK